MTDLQWAEAQDLKEPSLKAQFLFPPAHPLYFAGHSLGLQPRRAREYVLEELDEWARLAVDGHFSARNPWMHYHELLAQPLAALAGAQPREVVAMNTLSVNLHLLMVSFYRPTPKRNRILIETGAFPSDQYAVASQARFHGYPDAVMHSGDLLRDIDDSVALVLIGQPNYLTGQVFDVPALIARGHAHGCVVGVDLAHGAGNLLLKLHEWDADFAAWCCYKYLNGGPGSTGAVFIHERHLGTALPRFEGWWGHDKATRFEMGPLFKPMDSAEAWQLSNPPVLQLAALRASLELFPPMAEVRARGDRLTSYLERLLRALPGIEIVTPAARGSMLTVRVRGDARALVRKLHARGALVDFRNPDIIRITPSPLYGSYADVSRLCSLIAELA
jgi:kynureninase